MTEQNVLLIVSDEHAREALGCYGADHVHTPNIDDLAILLLPEHADCRSTHQQHPTDVHGLHPVPKIHVYLVKRFGL